MRKLITLKQASFHLRKMAEMREYNITMPPNGTVARWIHHGLVSKPFHQDGLKVYYKNQIIIEIATTKTMLETYGFTIADLAEARKHRIESEKNFVADSFTMSKQELAKTLYWQTYTKWEGIMRAYNLITRLKENKAVAE